MSDIIFVQLGDTAAEPHLLWLKTVPGVHPPLLVKVSWVPTFIFVVEVG